MLRQFRTAFVLGAALQLTLATGALAGQTGKASPLNPNIILSNQDRAELARAHPSFYWRPVIYGHENGVRLPCHAVIFGGMPGSDHLPPYYNYTE